MTDLAERTETTPPREPAWSRADWEAAVWADADHDATPAQAIGLATDAATWRRVLERLLDRTEDDLDAAVALRGPVRDQAVADIVGWLARLEDAYDRLLGIERGADEFPPVLPGVVVEHPVPEAVTEPEPDTIELDPTLQAQPAEVRLQASWSDGHIVAWAGGPGVPAADNEALSDRLEAIGGPPAGWLPHRGVSLPDGSTAGALSIGIAPALGWLVAVAGGLGGDGVGASVIWFARVALAAVRHVSRGGVVPSLHGSKRSDGRLDLGVRWSPALVDDAVITELAAAMPPPVLALAKAEGRAIVHGVFARVVDAIVAEGAKRLDFPAPPPSPQSATDVAEAVMTRLDGSTFVAPISAGTAVTTRLERWIRPVEGLARTRLVVQLEPPDRDGAWLLSVLGEDAADQLVPVEAALVSGKNPKQMAGELYRLERLLPILMRGGGQRRGMVVLSQAEAWTLMTVTGPVLDLAGFDVRVPALSRRNLTPTLKLFTGPAGDSKVGAQQLVNVAWTVLFDDVELTAADISRLANEDRPLVRSRGQWVELDRADLREAAAALAERATTTKLSGADVLRLAVGLDGTPLAGGISIDGSGWATDLLKKAKDTSLEPVTRPAGFSGELRSYQAEAVAWLGFLDATGLGGCLALDMGLGKTPTILAHITRRLAAHEESVAGQVAPEPMPPTLVIAPPAVVGNWKAEATKFAPGLKVVVHHGASRASASQLARELRGAQLVITTYGTAVRDVDAISDITWDRVVLDEAQAIKNPAAETSRLLRNIPSRSRIALTGTPIENGLGDLWSILDYTNPGLVGPRPAFIAQLAGPGEAGLRALNGILVFRRTKSEPEVAAELPDRIDQLDHCSMTAEQIGLYQAVLDGLVVDPAAIGGEAKQGAILAAITALKQICNHPASYKGEASDTLPLDGRSGKLSRLEEIMDSVFEADEKILIFTHFASWGRRLSAHLTKKTGVPIDCYDGSLARGARDKMVARFQERPGAGAMVLSLKAGGTGLNLTAASHVVLYDRWWNPAAEDQARDRAWRIGQTKTVVSHRLVCPGTIDERVEELVQGKRHVAGLVLPGSSSLADLDADQLRTALGLRADTLLTDEAGEVKA